MLNHSMLGLEGAAFPTAQSTSTNVRRFRLFPLRANESGGD
jgi:hypothetical protein